MQYFNVHVINVTKIMVFMVIVAFIGLNYFLKIENRAPTNDYQLIY